MATLAAEPSHGLIANLIVVPLLSGTAPDDPAPGDVELDTLLQAVAIRVIRASAAMVIFVRDRVTLPPLVDPSIALTHLRVRSPVLPGPAGRSSDQVLLSLALRPNGCPMACVIRSITIANSRMQIPATMPLPGS